MTHSGPWLPLILCIQHGAVTPKETEGRERWEEGGRGVCMRATDRSMQWAHAPPSVICACCRPSTLKYSTNEKALAGTCTSILLGIQGSYFEPHEGTLYITCTTHATHIQINTGQRGGSIKKQQICSSHLVLTSKHQNPFISLLLHPTNLNLHLQWCYSLIITIYYGLDPGMV